MTTIPIVVVTLGSVISVNKRIYLEVSAFVVERRCVNLVCTMYYTNVSNAVIKSVTSIYDVKNAVE